MLGDTTYLACTYSTPYRIAAHLNQSAWTALGGGAQEQVAKWKHMLSVVETPLEGNMLSHFAYALTFLGRLGSRIAKIRKMDSDIPMDPYGT